MGLRQWRRNRRLRALLDVRAPMLRDEHLAHCTVLADRLRLLDELPKQGVVAEIGVLHGEFSEEILERTQPRELHLIDLRDRWQDRFAGREEVVSHIGDSCAVLEGFDDAYFDWIYIDADHGYEGVRRDAEAASRKLKREGLLVFNDYTSWDGIANIPYGVPKVVHELCLEGWEMRYLALQPSGFHDVAIRRIP